MKKPHYRLRIRAYPGQGFCTVWLLRGQGKNGPWSGLLWGEMLPRLAEELVTVLGLPVDREESPFDFGPMTPSECTPFSKQGELFPENDPAPPS